jgi:glutathione S-transferase
MYIDELDFLQPLLDAQPYILGSHPSVAAFGYFGSMFRHFGNDPDPSEVMRRRAPAVYEWLAVQVVDEPSEVAGDPQFGLRGRSP